MNPTMIPLRWAQCLPAEVSYLDEMDGVHPADWQRENESEQR